MSTTTYPLTVKDLGRIGYQAAYAQQQAAHEAVLSEQAGPTVFLLEHDPVITISKRKAAPEHLVATEKQLSNLGIEVQPTDRGGDVTYHGPGQLVAYPILKLFDYGLNVSRYMRLLEQAIIDTIAEYDLLGRRIKSMTGVWVGSEDQPRKIAALGVRIRRGVSMHGLALNVQTDLTHFQTIVPCGIEQFGVTSLAAELPGVELDMQKVKRQLVTHLNRQLRNPPV